MAVKPFRPLLLIFYVACMMVTVMVISPEKLQLTDSTAFKVFTLDDLDPRPAEKTDISHIMELDEQLEDISSEADKFLDTPDTAAQASVEANRKENEEALSVQPEKEEKIGEVVRELEFPRGRFPLDNFFSALKNLQKNPEVMRVVHYGDSQIEGDRITQYLRHKLQTRFGGCGVGAVPIVGRKNLRRSVLTTYSDNWKKYAKVDAANKPAHNRIGFLNAYYKFTSDRDPETDAQDTTFGAWARFERSNSTFKNNKKLEVLRLMFRNPHRKLVFQVRCDGKVIEEDSLMPSDKFRVHDIDLKKEFGNIKIDFKTTGNPDIYGVALDCKAGVAVDNVGARGSGGIEFSSNSRSFYGSQIERMNVKLMILQYGVNVIPEVRKDYKFYERMFYSQLNYIKSVFPNAAILVVGVSDMSRKNGTEYETYPNVPLVRDAQRNAAMKAGCAFWDLYEAMGGDRSMITWVEKKLAGSDHTHFSSRGARIVGEMMYNSLMSEYDEYKKRNAIP